MELAYVILYLIAPGSGMMEVPERFETEAECRATFEKSFGTAAGGTWMEQYPKNLQGVCVPVMKFD